LGDSLPQAVLDRWREELQRETGFDIQAALRRRIEAYLDQGYGRCLFERRAGGDDGAKLTVVSRWRALQTVVVGGMSNHLHFLATPCAGIELSEIQHSLKSYTAHEANKILVGLDNSGR